MKHTPQRPFVPTPGSRPRIETAGALAFRIAHPFVHGTRPVKSAGNAPPSPPPPPLPLVYVPPVNAPPPMDTLAPIEQFLHAEPAVQSEPPGIDEYAYELPPVEHFMDREPEESGFGSTGSEEPATEAPDGELAGEVDTSEWSAADWQQFDWRSAAALGDASDPAASNAWSETDWEKAPPPPSGRDVRDSAAKAIADALDGIARRIREGDLSLPSPGSVSSPADIAATLAALLGVKR